MNTAVRHFQRFWADAGGYDGTLIDADRETMNLALNVRPNFEDCSGECRAAMAGGHHCKRPSQQCVTCGTKLKCSSHCEHSLQECREIFWAKHSRHGSKQRSVADFWKKPTPS